MGNTVRIGTQVTGVKGASSDLDNLKDKFKKLQSEGAKGLAIGAGVAASQAAFGLLDTAISGTINALGDAAAAAREDEESQTRLRASLVANVPAWNGNTTAIEQTISARMKLGFTDEEQRKSLALIVVATKDVTEALNVQRGAMDLARLKGISLEEASAALIKVEGGQFRALKALGIVLPQNATAVQALAAVEKAAAGQAEQYANTNSGKLLTSQVKVGEEMEKLGYIVMPALADATVVVADGVEVVANAIADATKVVGPLIDAGTALVGTLGTVNDTLGDIGDHVPFVAGGFDLISKAVTLPIQPLFFLKDRFDDLGRSAEHATDDAVAAAVDFAGSVQGMADDSRESSRITRQAIGSIGDEATDTARDVEHAFNRITAASLKARDSLLDDAQAEVTGYFDVLITQDRLVATEAEIAKNKRILASATATAAEKRDARVALHQLGADQAQYMQDLAKGGASGSKLFTKNMEGLLKRLKTAHGAERKEIYAEILALEILAAKAYDAAQKVKTAANGGNLPSYGGGRAAGGPVTKGVPYIVGENHPEVFVPDSNGTIIPNAPSSPSGGASSGGGGGMTFAPTVVVQGLATPAVKDQIVRELGPLFATWLRQNGYAPR